MVFFLVCMIGILGLVMACSGLICRNLVAGLWESDGQTSIIVLLGSLILLFLFFLGASWIGVEPYTHFTDLFVYGYLLILILMGLRGLLSPFSYIFAYATPSLFNLLIVTFLLFLGCIEIIRFLSGSLAT